MIIILDWSSPVAAASGITGLGVTRYLTSSVIIDISDSLILDLRHVLKVSKYGARIDLDKLPLSQMLSRYVDAEQALYWGVNGLRGLRIVFHCAGD